MFLVTGGAGFIGSHLVDRLLTRGDRVTCVDDFNDFYDPRIKRANIAAHLKSPAYKLVETDIRDSAAMEAVFEAHPVEKIVHLAARPGVRSSLMQPLLYEDVNVRATLLLLELAKKHKVRQIVFASSSSVYGAQTKVPFSETDSIDKMVSPYAVTKFAAELMCRTYHHLHGIPTTCLRFFTAYGPRQRPEMAIHRFTHLIHEGMPIPFFGDGSSGRDYTYIDDIVQGVLAAIDRPFGFEVFNLGESTTVTLRELVGQLERVCGKPALIESLPPQAGDVPITFADVTKARRMLDYVPSTSLETGLSRFVDWYRSSKHL